MAAAAHPGHGPHHPASSTPPRRPGSVRRTTTHDSLRPDGLLGPVVVVARGRDLRTTGDGDPAPLVSARLDVEVDYVPHRTVTHIRAEPGHEGLPALVGTRAAGGFRRAVDEALPGERESGSLRFQLLDDLPTALLVSGFAIAAGGVTQPKRLPMLQQADLCAGWVSGGTLLQEIDQGRPPTGTGPEAPSIESDDAWAWHEIDPLPPHGMRRRRRIDVWREDQVGQVEAFFRDSHVDGDGVETVVHEYTVHAAVDLVSMHFVSCDADVGVLPWVECPNALASARRLEGAAVAGLRHHVRQDFVGPTTCTHLNDTLRALEDVGALLDLTTGD